jgi:hypothetical protein
MAQYNLCPCGRKKKIAYKHCYQCHMQDAALDVGFDSGGDWDDHMTWDQLDARSAQKYPAKHY